jgi:hypothetical protein
MYHIYVLTFEEQARLKAGHRCEIVPGAHAVQFETRAPRQPRENGTLTPAEAGRLGGLAKAKKLLSPEQVERNRVYARERYHRLKAQRNGAAESAEPDKAARLRATKLASYHRNKQVALRYTMKGKKYQCNECEKQTDTFQQMRGHLAVHRASPQKGTPS